MTNVKPKPKHDWDAVWFATSFLAGLVVIVAACVMIYLEPHINSRTIFGGLFVAYVITVAVSVTIGLALHLVWFVGFSSANEKWQDVPLNWNEVMQIAGVWPLVLVIAVIFGPIAGLVSLVKWIRSVRLKCESIQSQDFTLVPPKTKP